MLKNVETEHFLDDQHPLSSHSPVAVITGATGGVGAAVAKAYAQLGYRLVLVGRAADRLARLNADLGGQHEIITADLSLVSENKRVGTEIAEGHGKVDVLLNLVGVIETERRLTDEGHERTLATNLLGPITLTKALGAKRVVVTGSEAVMFVKDLSTGDMGFAKAFNGFRAYARTKALLSLWAFTEGDTYGVTLADPGATKTNMAKSSAIPTLMRLVHPLVSHKPDVAAKAFVKAGHEGKAVDFKGKSVLPKAEKKLAQRFYDKGLGIRLAEQLNSLL